MIAMQHKTVALRTAAARPAPRAVARPLVCRARKPLKVDINTDEFTEKATEFASNTTALIATKWEEVEDKPAAVAVSGGVLLALIAVGSVVNTIDRIPVVSDLIELVGVFVTAWFAYRFLVVGNDREELVSLAKGFWKKVIG